MKFFTKTLSVIFVPKLFWVNTNKETITYKGLLLYTLGISFIPAFLYCLGYIIVGKSLHEENYPYYIGLIGLAIILIWQVLAITIKTLVFYFNGKLFYDRVNFKQIFSLIVYSQTPIFLGLTIFFLISPFYLPDSTTYYSLLMGTMLISAIDNLLVIYLGARREIKINNKRIFFVLTSLRSCLKMGELK